MNQTIMKTLFSSGTTKVVKWMLPFYLLAVCPLASSAQVGTWKAYASYYEPQQIAKGGNKLYVRASNGLYSYNLSDQSITTYDKVKELSDSYITHIAWNPTVKRLIVAYQNSNIDLIDEYDNVVNISALFTKSMTQDKTIHNIYIYDKYAYLATGFGVVKVNMERAEIAESYILNEDINAVGIDGNTIYIRNQKWEKFSADLSMNLIDPHNWTSIQSWPPTVFDTDMTDWDENIELVKTLKPGGPKHNYFGFLAFKNNQLYTCSGSGGGIVERPATVQIWDGSDWIIYDDNAKAFPGTESSTWVFVDSYSLDIDPLDHKHVFCGGRTGLYEYYDGQLKNYFNKDNSILNPATSSNKYVLVESVKYDDDGNLWLLQSQVDDNSIIEITKDGEWISHYHSELMDGTKSLPALSSFYFDSNNKLWFVNNHWALPSFYCYDTSTDQLINIFKQFNNQDGTIISNYNPRFVQEDLDGNLWLGTLKGPFMLERDNMYTTNAQLTQVKVPRNDGTDYADYLLADVDIKCMAVDGGNRKWFGTTSGLYLISADNMTQIANFTTSNSPLLSNNVEAIAINNTTGEVFIGTDQGLCSYMSDATAESIEMVKDNVYAYPNPVVSGYDGMITIVGLTRDADVKILSTSGQLVAQGRSNGGTFTWNGRDRSGKRVASGVYMVATATSDGKKGTVCKIAVIK